jgi:phosphoribosylanthranilate isomerase
MNNEDTIRVPVKDVALIKSVDNIIMSGGLSTENAWEIIKLVREHDSK